eukprot:TRINITY_DN23549_c0_g2_i4.p1 TRINITY_DN23549_c0_g2~~TRINITY_DN23549_c0_g2_i4.p1  ORF type:complete len:1590 (+),score=283.58 TRINITY_DN23549_c0_g2_i4:435-4772(+)
MQLATMTSYQDPAASVALDAQAPVLLEACSRVIVAFVVGLANQDWSFDAVESTKRDLFVKAIARTNEAFDSLLRLPVENSSWNAKLTESVFGHVFADSDCRAHFLGVRITDTPIPDVEAVLFLSPPAGRIALASILLALRATVSAQGRFWTLLAESALSLVAKVVQAMLPRAAIDSQGNEADGSARQKVPGAVLLSPLSAKRVGRVDSHYAHSLPLRDVWLRLSSFLISLQDFSFIVQKCVKSRVTQDTIQASEQQDVIMEEQTKPEPIELETPEKNHKQNDEIRDASFNDKKTDDMSLGEAELSAMLGRVSHCSNLWQAWNMPLTLPRILVDSALCTDCDTVALWRQECQSEHRKAQDGDEFPHELVHPHACARLRGDREYDLATCRLLARGFASLGILGGAIDSGLSKCVEEEGMTSIQRLFQTHPLKPRTLRRVSSQPWSVFDMIPLSALGLALSTRWALLKSSQAQSLTTPSSADSADFVEDKLHCDIVQYMDLQLFIDKSHLHTSGFNMKRYDIKDALRHAGAAGVPRLHRALFHPLIMPRFVTELIEQEGPNAVNRWPFWQCALMLKALKEHDIDLGAPEAYPTGIFMTSDAERSDAMRQVLAEMHLLAESEWAIDDAGPSCLKRKRTIDLEANEDEEKVELKLEEWRRSHALNLSHLVKAVPWMKALPGLGDVYRGAAVVAAERAPKYAACMEVLVLAARDIAVCPARWESWGLVAHSFKHLYFLIDDHFAQDEEWKIRLTAWFRKEPMHPVWSNTTRCFFNHANTVNLMLEARLEEELHLCLGELIELQADTSSNGSKSAIAALISKCQHIAEHWIIRQIDLLVLLICRKRAIAKPVLRGRSGDESGHQTAAPRDFSKRSRLAWRCDRIARRVLWFLNNCTQGSCELAETSSMLRDESIAADWPKPRFAENWAALLGVLQSRRNDEESLEAPTLLKFSDADGGSRALQQSALWFIPYVAARSQWRLRTPQAASSGPAVIRADLSDRQVLGLLADAVRLEASGGADGGCEVEPSWRLHSLRLRLALEEQRNGEGHGEDGWRAAAHFPWRTGAVLDTKETVVADCWAALRSLGARDTSYTASLALLGAAAAEREGRYAEAVAKLQEVFTFPKDFPENSGNMGMRIWKREAGAWRGPRDISRAWAWLGARTRKHNARRAKVLLHCLSLQRRILAMALPPPPAGSGGPEQRDCAAVVVRLLGELERGGSALRLDGASQELQMKRLAEPRGQTWEALLAITSLCVGVSRGVRPQPANRFWLGFHWAYLHTLRMTFSELLVAAAVQEDYTTAGTTRPLPVFDWPLLAMARSCWCSLEGSGADAVEISTLRKLFSAGMAQLRAFLHSSVSEEFGGSAAPRTRTIGKQSAAPEDRAEAYFRTLRERLQAPAQGLWGSVNEDFCRSGAGAPLPPPASPVPGPFVTMSAGSIINIDGEDARRHGGGL